MEEGFTAPSALRQKQTAAQCRLLIPQLLDFIRTLQTDGFELARTLGSYAPLPPTSVVVIQTGLLMSDKADLC